MKKEKCRMLVVCLIVTLLLLCSCSSFFNSAPITHAQAVSFENPYFNISNYSQTNSNVELAAFDGKLYVYVKRYGNRADSTSYEKCLYVFENGAFEKVAKVDCYDAMVNGVVYFYVPPNGGYVDEHLSDKCYFAYDLSQKQLTPLMENYIRKTGLLTTTVDQQGTYYIPIDKELSQYCAVEGSNLLGSTQRPQGLAVNNYYFYETKALDLIVRKPDGTEENLREVLDVGSSVSVVPCESGALLICEGYDNLLNYYDTQTETIKSLFSVEALSTKSAVNAHNDYAYFSFKRYERWGDTGKGMVRYENDTLEGTYRISLKDGSYEKINDNIYNGIYIFDDSGMYCVNERNDVYKLSFDGEILDVILLHE